MNQRMLFSSCFIEIEKNCKYIRSIHHQNDKSQKNSMAKCRGRTRDLTID